jgi:hypothetical protein
MKTKFDLQKYGTYIRDIKKISETYISFISAVPCARLFFSFNWISANFVESDNSNHTAGCILLADQTDC